MSTPPQPTPSQPTHVDDDDDDAVLEDIARRVAALARLAKALDGLGRHDDAAQARAEADDFAHLLALLTSPVDPPPGTPPVAH